MAQWVTAINAASGSGEDPAGAKAQTLPAASGEQPKKEKKPFFTLKGKK